MKIDFGLKAADLDRDIDHMWQLSARKIRSLEQSYPPELGAPVFTVSGRYTAKGWTDWTQGFQFGAEILQFDATGEAEFLELGREHTMRHMASHLTHVGVHDHGFNNVSTYGNLRRLMLEGRIELNSRELDCYELALKVSGAVQASRWSTTADGEGYICSFNGPHSLFCDTIRSLRSLAMSHQLGHRFLGENDRHINLLDRLLQHARTTARWNVFYGQQRDAYDVRGRVAHESIFNVNDGRYRCPSTQQGYSPFSTWTRGLAWIMAGYSEQLEWLATRSDEELAPLGGRDANEQSMRRAAEAACDFYIESTPLDGIPYWDTGAPGLVHLGDCLLRPADPFNDHEPVDSSAAAIAAQGLVRFGQYLTKQRIGGGERYYQAGLTVLRTLLRSPYLSESDDHQGLLLHTVYHRPRGWDHVPPGAKIPCGESCMWGDYHLREAANYVMRLTRQMPYYTFFGPID
jgi:hypothetical protein